MADEERDASRTAEPSEDSEKPQVYAVRRKPGGWGFEEGLPPRARLDARAARPDELRRRLLAGAGVTAAMAATIACGLTDTAGKAVSGAATAIAGDDTTATPGPGPTSTAAATPKPTAGQTATASPTAAAAAAEESCATLAAHSGTVRSLVFALGGSLLASAAEDGALKCWTMPGGGLIGTPAGKWPVLRTAAGDGLVAGDADGTVYLISLPDCTVRTTISASAPSALALTPDGKLLIVADATGSLTVWSLPDGEQVASLDGHAGAILLALAVSPDSTLLASGDSNGGLKIWSLESLSLVADLAGHDSFVFGLTFTPDGSLLVSAGSGEAVLLWSVDGTEVGRLATGAASVLFVATNADGSVLACSGDGAITFWSLPAGEALGTVATGAETASPIAISPDGSLLAAGNRDGEVVLCSLPDGSAAAYHPAHMGLITAVAMSPDGTLLVSGGADGTVRLWSLPGAKPAGCLADLAAVTPDVQASTYTSSDGGEAGATYTLPCGAAIPADAVCVCNCVAGTGELCGCVGDTTSCSCDAYTAPCSCDSVSSASHYWYPN